MDQRTLRRRRGSLAEQRVATEQQIWAQLLSAWIWIMDQNSQWIIELSIMGGRESNK